MASFDQTYSRKRTRMNVLERRANDGLWTPGMGQAPVETSSAAQATPIHSSPFAAPSPYRYNSLFISPLGVNAAANDTGATSAYRPLRLRSRALPSELETSSLSSANESPSSSSQSRQVANREQNTETHPAARPRPSATVVNAQPKAQAVVAGEDSPFWSTAGGIFHPDAQNPTPVSSSDAQALEQLPNSIASRPIENTPTFAGISALVFESASATAEPTIARTRAPQALASQRSAALASVLSPSPLPITQTTLPRSSPAAPSTVVETLASTATASSLVLTTTLVSATSQSSSIPSSSSSTSSSTTNSAAPASSSPTSFLATLGSSPLNITITVLVCVVILALIVAILFFFIRRCTRRRKRRRLGDILASEYGSPAPGGGGGGMSEWATPGPNWTEKYYGEQVGGRMVIGGSGGAGAAGVGAGNRFGAPIEEAYLPQRGDGLDGGYGVARTLSQQRRTSEWANYRNDEEFGRRGSWDEVDNGRLEDQTHVLAYDQYATPAPLPQAAIRNETQLSDQAPPPPPQLNAIPVRPGHLLATNYPSYCSDSTYPVDEAGDVEAEKKELSQTMQDLNLGHGSNSPPAQTSWRDSLDWVMGSAADLIGSKLLARGGSADTLVASPPEKIDDDRFTQRPPSIRIPRASDPRLVSDQFTPLSPSYGNRFLNPPSHNSALSRQSSIASLTSSANFATTNQAGTFAQSARSRLFDAALAKNAQEEDEMEILGDIAGAMMSRQTTTLTLGSEYPPEIPYPQFDEGPFHDSKRFVTSPDEMSGSSSGASTSSSFTDRPSPLSFTRLESPSGSQAMNHSDSFSSLGSKASFDAFGRGSLTPREYHRRLSVSRQRTMSRKSKSKGKKAPEMKEEYSVSSISTIDDFEIDFRQGQYLSKYGRSIEQNEKAKELLGERRRRSQEFEESLV